MKTGIREGGGRVSCCRLFLFLKEKERWENIFLKTGIYGYHGAGDHYDHLFPNAYDPGWTI